MLSLCPNLVFYAACESHPISHPNIQWLTLTNMDGENSVVDCPNLCVLETDYAYHCKLTTGCVPEILRCTVGCPNCIDRADFEEQLTLLKECVSQYSFKKLVLYECCGIREEDFSDWPVAVVQTNNIPEWYRRILHI